MEALAEPHSTIRTSHPPESHLSQGIETLGDHVEDPGIVQIVPQGFVERFQQFRVFGSCPAAGNPERPNELSPRPTQSRS